MGIVALAGCRPRATKPPYARGSAPSVAELVAATRPRISALQVPSAKVRFNRSIAGNLMMIAQAPTRFTGQVHVAGKELMSLAFHERGYTLRNVSDRGDLPVGFYTGTQTRCAIEPLIGSALAPDEFVQVVLGGIPEFPSAQRNPVEIVEQLWDGEHQVEVLRLRNGSYLREIGFTWFANSWWPTRAAQWRGAGDPARLMWSLEHEDLHTVGGAVLPKRTKISRPGATDRDTVTISYRKQVPNPPLPDASAGATEADTGDEGWDDDGWGDDEGEWEGEEGEESREDASPTPAKPTTPTPRPAAAVPALFVLTGDDLPSRGDLCARV